MEFKPHNPPILWTEVGVKYPKISICVCVCVGEEPHPTPGFGYGEPYQKQYYIYSWCPLGLKADDIHGI